MSNSEQEPLPPDQVEDLLFGKPEGILALADALMELGVKDILEFTQAAGAAIRRIDLERELKERPNGVRELLARLAYGELIDMWNHHMSASLDKMVEYEKIHHDAKQREKRDRLDGSE